MSSITQYARAWKFQFNSSYTVSNCVFFDGFAGDDLRGNGTKDFPFQTMNKAFPFANANGKYYIIGRGYFSEEITYGYGLNVISDQFGDFIYNGQNTYSLISVNIFGNLEKNGSIIINLKNQISTTITGSNVYINALYGASIYPYRTVMKGIAFSNIVNYGFGVIYYNSGQYSLFIDYTLAVRHNNANTYIKNIYDNCKVYLDISTQSGATFDTCLFRSNCTFYKINAATGVDERLDNDAMTANQKKAIVLDWLANGTCRTGYYKNRFNNCQWTDNRIFNCPDNDQSGTNWDFSLIYGTKEDQPACYMDNGKHIGPFAPAIKIELKKTADLTTSSYEVEVKDSDNLNLVNGQLTLGAAFAGATLYSKPMLLPPAVNFNGFNISLFADTANSGVFVTGRTDSIDTSVANRTIVSASGLALSANVCYLVMVDSGTTVTYDGISYINKTVLMATDAVKLASKNGSGNAYLYAINHPSIWQEVQFKIWEGAVVPADFKTNDVAYPWLEAEMFSKPADTRGTNETGLRCLRVSNVANGVIDSGTDGKPLTSAHPEYYNTANQLRAKFFVRANYVMLKITIAKLF